MLFQIRRTLQNHPRVPDMARENHLSVLQL